MNRQYVSVAGLKIEGWTDRLIDVYLGEPDRMAPNPHYSSAGAPMRLYLRERVVLAAKRGDVAAALAQVLAKREGRQKAAQKGVQTKEARAETRMLNWLKPDLKRVLKDRTWAQLVRAACDSYNAGNGIPYWAYGKREWADRGRHAQPDDDADFILRITCNYVRHQLLGYDAALGGVGKDAARDAAHDSVEAAVTAKRDAALALTEQPRQQP
jgi:hypothetical protein